MNYSKELFGQTQLFYNQVSPPGETGAILQAPYPCLEILEAQTDFWTTPGSERKFRCCNLQCGCNHHTAIFRRETAVAQGNLFNLQCRHTPLWQKMPLPRYNTVGLLFFLSNPNTVVSNLTLLYLYGYCTDRKPSWLSAAPVHLPHSTGIEAIGIVSYCMKLLDKTIIAPRAVMNTGSG